jgi:hypothetical protein
MFIIPYNPCWRGFWFSYLNSFVRFSNLKNSFLKWIEDLEVSIWVFCESFKMDYYYPYDPMDKRLLQTQPIKVLINIFIWTIFTTLLWIIFTVLFTLCCIIYYILKYVLISLWYITITFLYLFVLWTIYKFIAVILLEVVGVGALALLNMLLILFIISNIGVGPLKRIEKSTYIYNWRRPNDRYTYDRESYPLYEVKIGGISLAEWVIVGLLLIIVFLFLILPLISLIVNLYIGLLFSSGYIFVYLLTWFNWFNSFVFEINEVDLMLLSLSSIPIKSKSKSKSKPGSKTNSNLREEKVILKEEPFTSNKFKLFNGLELPGVLFHFSEIHPKLMDEFEKCLSSTPDISSIYYIIDKIEWEIEKARSITEHGFIHSDDLTNSYAFPVISGLVGLILNEPIEVGEYRFGLCNLISDVKTQIAYKLAQWWTLHSNFTWNNETTIIDYIRAIIPYHQILVQARNASRTQTPWINEVHVTSWKVSKHLNPALIKRYENSLRTQDWDSDKKDMMR